MTNDELREAVDKAIAVGDVRWLFMPDDQREMVMEYVNKAISAARPYIEAETVEKCAKVAAEYGPSRPMATNMAFSIIRGRWEGERAASANIAAAIRSLSHD